MKKTTIGACIVMFGFGCAAFGFIKMHEWPLAGLMSIMIPLAWALKQMFDEDAVHAQREAVRHAEEAAVANKKRYYGGV